MRKSGSKGEEEEGSDVTSGDRVTHETSVAVLMRIVDDLVGALLRGRELQEGDEEEGHGGDLKQCVVHDVEPPVC